MKEIKIRDPQAEAKALLEMDTQQATIQFQQYTTEEQLVIIETVADAKSREELYYLVPDCTELVQGSPTENVMQMALVHLEQDNPLVFCPGRLLNSFQIL